MEDAIVNRLPEQGHFFLAVAVLVFLGVVGVILAHASKFFESEPSVPIGDDGGGVVLAHVSPAIKSGYEVTCSQWQDGWVRLTVRDGKVVALTVEGNGSAAWWKSVRGRLAAMPRARGGHA